VGTLVRTNRPGTFGHRGRGPAGRLSETRAKVGASAQARPRETARRFGVVPHRCTIIVVP